MNLPDFDWGMKDVAMKSFPQFRFIFSVLVGVAFSPALSFGASCAVETSSNLITNACFEHTKDPWRSYGHDAQWVDNEGHSGTHSIKLENKTAQNAGWRYPVISIDHKKIIKFGGWNKADNVGSGALNTLDFKVTFSDGSYKWFYPSELQFSKGTHGWEHKEFTKIFDKDVVSIRPYALLYHATGTAWFDDIYVVPITQPTHTDNPSICMESLSYGKKDGIVSACFNPDGIFTGGSGCIQQLKLRNLSDLPITKSSINVDYSHFLGALNHTCGIDGTDQTDANCNVSTSPKEARFNPIGSFDAYKTHVVYLGVTTSVGNSSPFDGNITVNYEQGGTQYTGTLQKCQVAPEPAEDLCYDPPVEFKGLMCFQMGDFFGGGFGCKTTIHIRNQGGDSLYNPVVSVITNSMFSGHMMDDCGIDNVSGNCSDNDVLSGPFMGMSGMGMPRSLTYDPLPDFDGNDTHNVYSKSLMSMHLFSKTTMLGTYVKNGKVYRGVIHKCGAVIPPVAPGAGLFDAWDTFRDQNTTPPSDKSISTKIINAPFKLSLASYDTGSNNAYKKKPSVGNIDVAIYPKNSLTPISNTIVFDTAAYAHISETTDSFTVSEAAKEARVGFKFCATYMYDLPSNTEQYHIYDASHCAGQSTVDPCETLTYDTPTWHVCYASDDFAIRPKSFDVNITSGTVLTAGKACKLQFKALAEDNTTANDYNEIEGNSFDVSLALKNPNCPYQTADISPNVNFTNGVDNNTFTFNRVGSFHLTIAEKNTCRQKFAAVDCDDANVNGHWNVDDNLSIEPKTVPIALIPDHFSLTGTYRDHHIASTANDQNFTYLSNFSRNSSGHAKAMASEYNLTITAKKADDTIASNYTDGCFAQTLDMNITYKILDGNGNDENTSLTKVQYFAKDLDGGNAYHQVNIGNDINYTFPSTIFDEDINGTANVKLDINFDRRYDQPIDPFIMRLKTITISDHHHVDGNASIDQNSTYLYARAKSSKYVYDDVVGNSVKTPISVVVYCSAAACPGVDKIKGQTNEYLWFYSVNQNTSAGDGKIKLAASSGGQINPTVATFMPATQGLNNTVTALCTGANSMVDITLNQTNPTDTNSWLIYNKDFDGVPSPFYRVHCIGTGTWGGSGKTGHVVGGDTNTKKTHRLGW